MQVTSLQLQGNIINQLDSRKDQGAQHPAKNEYSTHDGMPTTQSICYKQCGTAEINRTSSNMQSILQLVFSTSMLTIWISSNGLSLRSVLAFSIVITTSLPLVTYKQRNTYIVPIHVLNNRYLQRMMCNIPYTSRTCQGQHNSSKRVKEGSDL